MGTVPRKSKMKTVSIAEADALLTSGHLVISSAPLLSSVFTRAIVTIGEVPFRQVLFGWEAGLRAFATALARRGETLYITPAPEIFSRGTGRQQIYTIAGEDEERPLLHLRFGPPVMARVLRPATNWHVLLDSRLALPLVRGDHPLGSGDTLPQSVDAVCSFEPPLAPLHRLRGEALPILPLDLSFATLDLEAELSPVLPRRLSLNCGLGPESGLIVQSFAEFDAGSWQEEVPPLPRRFSDWRGVVALERLVRREGARRWLFVLLPWNVSYPASIVPDLLLKFARSASLSAYDCRLVVFPYNETSDSGGALASFVAEMRKLAQDHPNELRHHFLARYRGGAALGLLSSLVDIAWLEAGSPDFTWTAHRLAAAGIPHIAIGTTPAFPPLEASCAAVPGDETLDINTDDSWGRRHFQSASLSENALHDLFRESFAYRKTALHPLSSSPSASPPATKAAESDPLSGGEGRTTVSIPSPFEPPLAAALGPTSR